jgi:hypothetical protein
LLIGVIESEERSSEYFTEAEAEEVSELIKPSRILANKG